MQSKEYLKNKARQIAKQTWAGPGKFGVFIVLCIIVVATFESLGLSNREKNLEIRNVQNIVFPVTIINDKNKKEELESLMTKEKPNTDSLNEKLKISAVLDFERKSAERENLLIYAAMDQFLYENNYIVNDENKTKQVLSILLRKSHNIVESTFSNEEEVVFADL